MKKLTTIALALFAFHGIGAQSLIQAYKNRADMVSQTNITTSLQEFANLGVKTTGSVNNANALNWIKTSIFLTVTRPLKL